jgi:hypothetical protein
MTDWIPWPRSVPPRNLTGTQCDMLIGPCACGATHTAFDVALGLVARDESERDAVRAEREACAQAAEDPNLPGYYRSGHCDADCSSAISGAIRARGDK